MVGILAAHGHDLTILETHSWAQVSLLTAALAKHETNRISMFLEPLLKGINPNIVWNKGKVTEGKSKPVDRDKQREAALRAHGIKIHDE